MKSERYFKVEIVDLRDSVRGWYKGNVAVDTLLHLETAIERI